MAAGLNSNGRLRLDVSIERWPLKAPFRITGHLFETHETLVVSLAEDGLVGQGEAAGVYYLDDRVAGMAAQIEALRPEIEAGMDRLELQDRLPPGGARNALDCAMWDLEAKRAGMSISQLLQADAPRPLFCTFTLGADAPEVVAFGAAAAVNHFALKLKLNGDGQDAERVAAAREARPGAWIGVDANQGLDRAGLERLMPALVAADVRVIEQPLPVGREADLKGLESPIPIAADESILHLADLERLAGAFDIVNIKLDKCGGLTEALAMAHRARELGLGVMVGNMIGTTLAMAPAFLLGQMCDVVDLDGPLHLVSDRAIPATYDDNRLFVPEAAWGARA